MSFGRQYGLTEKRTDQGFIDGSQSLPSVIGVRLAVFAFLDLVQSESWHNLLSSRATSSRYGQRNEGGCHDNDTPNRRSSFGTNCAHCGHGLIAPEWTEYRDEPRCIHHVWRCWNCDYCFDSAVSAPADTEAMEDIMTSDDFFRSLLVA